MIYRFFSNCKDRHYKKAKETSANWLVRNFQYLHRQGLLKKQKKLRQIYSYTFYKKESRDDFSSLFYF